MKHVRSDDDNPILKQIPKTFKNFEINHAINNTTVSYGATPGHSLTKTSFNQLPPDKCTPIPQVRFANNAMWISNHSRSNLCTTS